MESGKALSVFLKVVGSIMAIGGCIVALLIWLEEYGGWGTSYDDLLIEFSRAVPGVFFGVVAAALGLVIIAAGSILWHVCAMEEHQKTVAYYTAKKANEENKSKLSNN